MDNNRAAWFGFENRMVTHPPSEDEDNPLRPRLLSEYIGQEKVKENLSVFIDAAKLRRSPLTMCCFTAAGLGKTTLAGIIANEMGLISASPPGRRLKGRATLPPCLQTLNPGTYCLLTKSTGCPARSRRYSTRRWRILRLTLSAARAGRGFNPPAAAEIHLDRRDHPRRSDFPPLRDRFGVVLRLELYSPQELAEIVTRSARILEIPCDSDGAYEIASRSRGTPRIANRLLKRVRDFAQVMGEGRITLDAARKALKKLEVDELGLDTIDRRMLKAMITHYGGGPVGLDTVAALIGEEAITIEDVYEPYLMQIGFLSRTPRGRVVLPGAYQHLGIEYNGQLTF